MTEPLSFKDMLKALEQHPKAQEAAIRVHDDLDVARSIAKDLFESCEPDVILEIRKLLVEREGDD